MARIKKFNVTREVFKIAKSANRLRKALDSHSELLEQTKGKPANKVAQDNTAYERRIFHRLGSSVERHFYTKLVGVSFQNSDTDKSSRRVAIQTVEEYQELELRREPQNKFDPNAILVCVQGDTGVGYLNERLAGEVTRSQNKGALWHCYVRRVLHAPGTQNWGVTVCMVRLKNAANYVDSSSGLSGTEFLAKYYPDFKPPKRAVEPRPPGKGLVAAMALFIILMVLLVIIINSG